jgi:hypothetical protein
VAGGERQQALECVRFRAEEGTISVGDLAGAAGFGEGEVEMRATTRDRPYYATFRLLPHFPVKQIWFVHRPVDGHTPRYVSIFVGRSQFPSERFIEDGGQQRVKFCRGFGLQLFQGIYFGLQVVKVGYDAALFGERGYSNW